LVRVNLQITAWRSASQEAGSQLDFMVSANEDKERRRDNLLAFREGFSMSSLPARKPASVPTPGLPLARTVVIPERDVVIPASAHTLSGFRAWATSEAIPERGRFSFIGPEIFVDMSPEELETHGNVKAEVSFGIMALNKKQKLGRFFPDRTLLTNVAADLSTEPDAAFATWKSLESGRCRFIPREDIEGHYLELEGTPDWVLEIVSQTSVQKDTQRLREKYHRAGIPEYWLIDARGEEIDFQILVRQQDDYGPVVVSRGGWQTSPVFRRRFRLVRQRGRMNFWEYTLQVKAAH
jgi:Uma2 family endonuclease